MAKEKRVGQEEKEWIRAEIQANRQLIKERDEKLQRKAEIRAIRKVIRALEEKERHQIEKREFSKGISVVEVLCYLEEGEALEEEEYVATEHMGAKEEEQILPWLEEQMVGQCIKSVAEDVDRPSDWDAGKENGSFSENEVDKVTAEEKIAYWQLLHVGIEVPRKDIEQGVTEKIGGVPMVNAVGGQKAVKESLNVLKVTEQRTNDNLKNEFMEKDGSYQGFLVWLLLIRLMLCKILWLYFDRWRKLKKIELKAMNQEVHNSLNEGSMMRSIMLTPPHCPRAVTASA